MPHNGFSAGNVKRPRGINIGDSDRGRVKVFRATYNDRLVARLPSGGSIDNQPRNVMQMRVGGRGGSVGRSRRG